MSGEVNMVVRGPGDVASFLQACRVPTDAPAQILLGLAVAEADLLAHTVCGAAVRSGPDAARGIDAQQLVDLADELLMGALVLATVEPGNAHGPGRPELVRFVALRRACADSGVALLDWVVLAGPRWWSMREQVIREAA
jgi:hypothetical protein